MNYRRIQNLGLIAGGLLIGLAGSELYLRLFRPQIFEMHPRGMYVEDAEVGYTLAPNFVGTQRRTEFEVEIRTGEAGLRGEDPEPRRPDSYRILVLGDSQAWGFGVENSETFSAQMALHLTKDIPDLDIQVFNGGVSGYGTADQLNFLRSRGEALAPNLVIVQFLSTNDLLDNRVPATEWATVQDGYLSASEGSGVVSEQVPLWLRTQWWVKNHVHLARLVLDSVGYLGIRVGILGRVDALWGEDFTDEDAEVGRQLLMDIIEESRLLGAWALVLYTTGQAQILADEYVPMASRSVVEEAVSHTGTPWIDATLELRRLPNRLDLYYPKNGHWTVAGHSAIADILTRKIVELEMVPKTIDESVSVD